MNKFLYLFIFLFLMGKVYGQNEIWKNDLSLNEAIETGLKYNPEIKSSLEKINAASGRFWSGISLPQPEISSRYEWIPINRNLKHFGERTFEVVQPFDFPSNYFLRGSKFSKDIEIMRSEYKLTELLLIVRIKSAYFSALTRQEQLLIAKENLSIAEDFYKKAEIRYNVGEGTNLERLTAKVQYTEALNNVEVQKNRLKSAFAELNFALGYGKDETKEYNLTDSLDFTQYDFSLEKLFDEALNINPLLKRNELFVSSSSISKTLAWSSLLPNFNVSYFRQTQEGISSYYGASLGISVPLWFLFDQRGKIEEATANVKSAEADYSSSKNLIYLRIRNAFIEFTNAEKQVRLYQTEILPQAEEVFRTASRSYDAGEITYIEFLQAKQTLINSKNNYLSVLLNYNQAIILLEEAVGKRFD